MQALIVQYLLKASSRPASFAQGQAIAVIAAVLAAGARALATPILGSDVSFITAIPVVLLASFFGGSLAGLTTVIAGTGLDLLISRHGGAAGIISAAPRLIVWLTSAAVIIFITSNLRGALKALRQRESDLVKAQVQLQLLNRELEHRGRNALTIVSALSDDVARSAQSVSEFRQTLGGRLRAMATSYRALTRTAVTDVALLALIQEVLAPFARQVCVMKGADCSISASTSLALSLALHELATNATKYGALSVPSGQVCISWTLGAEDQLALCWAESGGPAPKTAMREGFGSTLLQTVFRGTPNGSFKSTWRPQGMSFQMTATASPKSTTAEDPNLAQPSLKAANDGAWR